MEKVLEREGAITIERWDGGDINAITQSSAISGQFLKLCEDLGFAKQPLLLTPVPYPRLSYVELRILHDYLPTYYHEHGWKQYVFDRIPLVALREIQRAKELGCFDHLVIRTPELRGDDPVVLGYDVIGRAYLITRWGESLKSFEEMRKELRLQIAVRWIRFLRPVLIVCVALAAFAAYHFAR